MKRRHYGLTYRAHKALSEKEFIALFALMMSLTALSMDAVLPAFRPMAESLSLTHYTHIQWVVPALIMGTVFGELLFGPLSDAIGRKASIVSGVSVYILGCFIAMNAHSIEVLLFGRFIQGFGVAGPKIASRALIRDLHSGMAMARILSYVMVIFILVPMLAPSFGQLILMVANWRWIFGALVMQALIACVWLLWRQPETLALEKRQPLSFTRLYRDGRYILSQRVVLCYTAMAGLTFAGLMLYLAVSQSIFQDLYHTGDAFPLYFAMMAGGSGLASFLNGKLVMRLGMLRLVSFALTLQLCAALALSLCSWYFSGVPPLGLFLVFAMPIFFSMGLLFGNLNAMALEPLGHVAGLGASLVSSLTSFIAVILSVVAGTFYHFTVTPLAVGYVIFTCASLVALVIANRAKSSAETAT